MATSTVQGAGTPVFGLRGVSMNDWSFNQTGPVAVYLDEGYKGNPSLLAVPFFDLERVEVLRGPQGTLYGKNTTGGAVNFITRQPTMENAGTVTVGAGNYGLSDVEAAFNAVLSDVLAVRLAGTYAQQDGWLKNVTPGIDDGNSIDEHGVRLSVLWRPQDNLDVLLRASSAQSDPITFSPKMAAEAQPSFFGIYGLSTLLAERTCPTRARPVSTSSRSARGGSRDGWRRRTPSRSPSTGTRTTAMSSHRLLPSTKARPSIRTTVAVRSTWPSAACSASTQSSSPRI